MAETGKAVITVEIDPAHLSKVIADAIEEHMALPVCEREHVEPLAEWEKELLGSMEPRVVTDRSQFEVGQIVALISGGCEMIARVTKAKNGEVEIKGRYLHGEEARQKPSPPYLQEVQKGEWLILKNAPRPA